MERLRKQAEVLARLIKALADASTDRYALMTAVAVETACSMDAFCRFMQVSDDREWLVPGATGVPVHRPLGDEARRLLDQPVRIDSNAVPARAVREQCTIHNELTEQMLLERFPDPAERVVMGGELATKDMVLVPAVGSLGVQGVLILVRRGEDAVPFDDDDVRFAEQLAAHAGLALTNAKLVIAAQERADRLQLVSALTRELAQASGNFQQLLEVIVRRLGGAFADFCVIRMVRPDGGFGVGGAIYNSDPELEQMHRAVFREISATAHPLLVGRALATGTTDRVTHIDLPAMLAAMPAPFAKLMERIAPVSYMAVPLKLHGPPFAVLVVGRAKGGRPFTADEQQVVEDLATHAAIAITNARLIETAARTTERLRVVTAVAAELDASVDEPQGILAKVAHKLSELVGGTSIVQAVAADGETIEPTQAVVDPDPSIVARIRSMLGDGTRKADGVTQRVLRGEAVMISGTPSEVAAPTSPHARATIAGLGVRSVLSLPLRVGVQVIGTATLLRREGAPFTQDDLQFAQDLLTHAALAIRNSRLLGSVQHELAERQRTERALRQSEEQFRHAQKMEAVGRLAGGVAHDFNNILTVVLHSCGFIKDAMPASSPILEDVEQIRQAGERAAKLTRQLLAFSRQEVVQPEVLDLGKHVAKLRSLLTRLLGERCTLVLRTAKDLGKVKADGSHIEQIVMNLAVNARDAMPAGGTLTVETENVTLDESYAEQHIGVKAGPYVMLAVSDTGEGMTKETQDRIFEPFFTTKPVGRGTGLGLSTVFGIVEQTGGTIWTYSELGKGTTFKIYLPRTDDVIAPEVKAPAELASRSGETILVVEDEDMVRRTVVRALGRKGYRVIETSNGREALETYDLRAAEIDLVLTDVMMPLMGGGELAKRLLIKQPTLPVLFMSGYIDDSILEAGMIEPDTLISKPLNLDVLLRKIRAGLDGRQS